MALVPVCTVFLFCMKRSPTDQSCALLHESQATNISLMSAFASLWISDTEDGRACHELCVVEAICL